MVPMVGLLSIVALILSAVTAHHKKVACKHQDNENKESYIAFYTQCRQNKNQKQRKRAADYHPQAMLLHLYSISL
jgi:hypothetical protein